VAKNGGPILTMEMPTMLPALKYLMNELKFKTSDWVNLPEADKQTLKTWAEEEQQAIAAEQTK